MSLWFECEMSIVASCVLPLGPRAVVPLGKMMGLLGSLRLLEEAQSGSGILGFTAWFRFLFSVSLLLMQDDQPASWFRCHALLIMMDGSPSDTKSENRPFLPSVAFVGELITAAAKWLRKHSASLNSTWTLTNRTYVTDGQKAVEPQHWCRGKITISLLYHSRGNSVRATYGVFWNN